MKFSKFAVMPVLVTAISLAQEAATGTEQQSAAGCLGGGGITGLLPIVAMVAIFYFLIIRPQQKQSKQLSMMRSSLKKGDSVVTGGGIHGVITNLKGDIVSVKIADTVKIDVDRNSLTLVAEEIVQE